MIIDGKKEAQLLRDEIKKEIESIKSKNNEVPGLTVILIGDFAPSQIYVKNKQKNAKEVGINSEVVRYPKDVSEKEVLKKIIELNENDAVSGILVQLPLPSQVNKEKIINAINPLKDVDGFHPINYGKMALGIDTFLPATPAGIIELIERSKIQTEGKKCLVIGRSQIVGRPISILLSQNKIFGNSTVTVAHSRTSNLEELCLDSDLIISAIGKPEFIKGNMIKKGSTVIDVGITRVDDSSSHKGYRIAGDVDFNSVSSRVGFITPVPGGVGPMTIAMLLKNTLKACSLSD